MVIQLGFVIDKPIDEVVTKFISIEDQLNWRKDINRITLVDGILNTSGSVYELESNNLVHTKRILDIDLPNYIKYEYDKSHRICEHRFREHDDHVHYNVTVTYKMSIIKTLFLLLRKKDITEKMNQQLLRFKEYVESN